MNNDIFCFLFFLICFFFISLDEKLDNTDDQNQVDENIDNENINNVDQDNDDQTDDQNNEDDSLIVPFFTTTTYKPVEAPVSERRESYQPSESPSGKYIQTASTRDIS